MQATVSSEKLISYFVYEGKARPNLINSVAIYFCWISEYKCHSWIV